MTGRPVAGESRELFPSLCSILGTLLLVLVIVIFLPLAIPRMLGYEIYEVISESMEPEIPVGSAVYVKAAEPETISGGDIIVFQKGTSVITHRVLENKSAEREFITKGDANDREDLEPVPYEALTGQVKVHVPLLGTFMAAVSGGTGKICAVFAVFWGVMLHMLAGIWRVKRGKGNGK